MNHFSLFLGIIAIALSIISIAIIGVMGVVYAPTIIVTYIIFGICGLNMVFTALRYRS